MVEVKVKLENEDQNLPLARKLCVSTRTTTVTTPSRAFHLKQDTSSESRLIQNDKVRGINEIYHVLTKEKIEEIDNDVDKLNEFGKKLRYIFSAPKIKDELNLLFFSYENKTPKVIGAKNVLPSDDEIEYLCNIVTHPQSEIIIPPFIPDLTGYEYLQFLKKFFTYYKSYSKKTHTIMGYIPMVATSELRDINQFYFENGINLFTVDFSGKYPMDSYILINEIRKLTRAIKKEYRKESYLHAFNVPFARAQPTTYISPAKDIFTLIAGFDSFGTYHKKDSKPPEVIEKIKEQIEKRKSEMAKSGQRYTPPFRLFNRKDYGYYKNDATRLEETFKDTKDSVIKLSDLVSEEYSVTKVKGIRRAFNVEKHALEAVDYQTQIDENSMTKHLMQKTYGVENFKRITRLIN